MMMMMMIMMMALPAIKATMLKGTDFNEDTYHDNDDDSDSDSDNDDGNRIIDSSVLIS